MNILQVLPRLESGGVERGTIEIAKALTKAGFASFVASSGGKLVDELLESGSHHFNMKSHSKNPFIILLNSLKLIKIIKKHNIEIIHARSRAPAWSCIIAAKITGIKFITTIHGRYGIQNSIKKLYNSVMTRGDKVIAISNFIEKYAIDNYKSYLTPGKLVVIHRGVDSLYFSPESISFERLKAAQSHIKHDASCYSILMPARMTRIKGHIYLLNILKHLKIKKWKCYIVGICTPDHIKYMQEVKNSISELSLSENVFISNSWNDMPALYKCADLIISTSSSPEAFGRTILEAQTMGKIVLASAHGGALELISDQENGFYIPQDNAQQAALIIERAANMSEQEKKSMSIAAINNASKYTLDDMCKKTLKTYKSLLK